MSIRTQLKVPRYGLFYFESDKTVSIVPLKNISKVLEGDNTSKGSVVVVEYGKDKIKAQIIAVHDDQNELKEKEIQFICDPSNKELFPEEDEDEEDEMELGLSKKIKNERKRNTEEQTMAKQQQKKQKVGKKGTSNEMKKSMKKENDQATVVARFQPAVSEATAESNHPVSPQPVERNQWPKSPINLPSSPLPNLSPSSSIYIRNTPIHSTPTDFTPTHFTPPPHSPSPVFQSRVSGVQSNRPVAQRSLSNRYNEMPSVQASEMLWLLTRVEKKIDQLASLEKKIDNINYILTNDSVSRLNPCVNVHDETKLYSNNVVDDSSSTLSLELSGMSKSFNNDIVINNGPLDNDWLMHIHHQANSSANFAVRLVRELFTTKELIGRNVAGARGKEQLDPARVEKIMELVNQFYPAPPVEKMEIFRKCRKGIDSYLRKLK